MKVAIIMPLAEIRGGGEKRLWDLMLKGRNNGIDWLVIFQQEGSLVKQIESLGVCVRIVPSGRLRQLPNFFSSVVKIAEILRCEKADVVLGWMWKAHLYGYPAAKLAKLPALWSQLEVPDDSLLKRIVTCLPTSGMFINSIASKAVLEKHYPQRPIRLVYPGVDLNKFDTSLLPSVMEARRKLNLPLTGPLIGIVSRLQRWKGIHILIEAMLQVLSQHPNAHCVVVGGRHHLEPDYENELKHRISALELDEQIILVGAQSNVPEWMQAMDVFVHASNNEPFGIVIVEAMALAKPVVATVPGGPKEIITDGKDGLLVPYGDVEALSKAVLHYLDNPEFAHNVGLSARQRATDFSTQRYAENFISALRDLVSN